MELSSFRKNWWSLVSDVLCFKNWAFEGNWFNYFWRRKGNSESKQSNFERDSKCTNRLISRSHAVAYNDYAAAPEPLSNELPDRQYESEPEYENQNQLKHHDDNNKQSKPDVVNDACFG